MGCSSVGLQLKFYLLKLHNSPPRCSVSGEGDADSTDAAAGGAASEGTAAPPHKQEEVVAVGEPRGPWMDATESALGGGDWEWERGRWKFLQGWDFNKELR